jgi:predicted HicB family RNase H-like nuclease
MTPEEFQKKIEAIPAEEPDAFDLEMLAEIEAAQDDGEGVTLEQIVAQRTYSGRLMLRVPRVLHSELAGHAREQGVSLNQYCLYKLSR